MLKRHLQTAKLLIRTFTTPLVPYLGYHLPSCAVMTYSMYYCLYVNKLRNTSMHGLNLLGILVIGKVKLGRMFDAFNHMNAITFL